MTDAQYTAKTWLTLLSDYEEKLKAEKRTLEMLNARLFKGVSRYEACNGRRDPMSAREAQEDALIELAEQGQRIEKAQKVYIAEMKIRREVLETINLDLQAIAIDRYINGLSWDQIERAGHYSRANLFRLNLIILDEVAEILNAKKTQLTITKNKRKKEAAAV